MKFTHGILVNNKARILFLVFVLLFLFPVLVFAQEKITDFKSDIKINPDSSVMVSESINYDFNGEKHGIFRNIPFHYEDSGRDIYLNIDILDIRRDGVSEEYEMEKEDDYIKIKIGDPDRIISGSRNYLIRYKVEWPINFFDDFDEFYWNITGHEWDVPILDVDSTVELPERVEEDSLRVECYEGDLGSNDPCSYDTNFIGDKSVVSFESRSGLHRVRALLWQLVFRKV